ncbi:MAG TPA: sigma 54-interacting transcriptional regulator [Smithellaceae bacterium]|nr:sigma 54-interacting transcriptional regulator [Smithellaceae bacterium]
MQKKIPVARMAVKNKKGAQGQSQFKPASTRVAPDRLTDPVGRDAAYRKKKEATTDTVEGLRRIIDSYATIIDRVEDCVGQVDLTGNIVFTNKAGVRIWGFKEEGDIIGLNFRQYMDPETADFVFKAYHRVFQTGRPDKITYDIIRQDGAQRTIEDSVAPIRSEGKQITGFQTVSRDVTERLLKEKELAAHRSRLEAIFRSVKDAIITVDSEMNVIEANMNTETICGLQTAALLGKTFSECLAQCNRSCIDVLRQTLDNRTTVKEYRIECGHTQHQKQQVSVTSSPLLDPEGCFMGAVLVIRDMTLLTNLERELRERNQFQNIIGRSKKMQEIFRLLEDLADLDTTVLITGESGTGKELVARALHYSGIRAFKPFVTVNCSALTESLLESELFGHVRGAFTGAIKDRQGRFQAAEEGTILLDEIGDISPVIQVKLLRVLQEKIIERVGESVSRPVNVRVIASTNRNLREKVRIGEFREDLYYRLKVVEVALPPLRERLEDLPLLIDHFRQVFNKRFKKNVDGFSNEVLDRFMDYPWPGNIRELEHVIEHAFILCHGNILTYEHLPTEIRAYPEADDKKTVSDSTRRESDLFAKTLDALSRAGGNKAKAARLLGIDRRTLYRRLDKYNIAR